MRRVLLACLGIATLSLLLPSEPSYDPWAWIVWGREAATLSLDTTGGPSFKPLPVLLTTLFAPTGAISDALPPALWLLVARAGTFLALALAFRLAARLAGGRRRRAWTAGAIAALTLALTPDWLRYAAHGNEVPLAIALLLWAADRGLDRDECSALVLGVLACLLRPEAILFVGGYGAWLFWSRPARRGLIAGLGVALLALWIVPEWVGSGHPLDASDQARSEPSWSLSLRDEPWLAALERLGGLLGVPLGIAVVAAVATSWRSRADPRARVTLALAAAAVGWVGLIVAMTQFLGFSGSARYFMPAVTCGCVLTGVGTAGLVASVLRAWPPARGWTAPRLAAPAIALVALIAVGPPWLSDRGRGMTDQWAAAGRLAAAERGLAGAVDANGGAEGVVAVGAPRVDRAFHTRMAWETRLTLGEVERAHGPGLRFVGSAVASAPRCRWAGNTRDIAERWCVTVVGGRERLAGGEPADRDVRLRRRSRGRG